MLTENNFITFDEHVYAIDINKLLSYVAKPSVNESVKDKTKVEHWGLVEDGQGNVQDDFRLISKEMSETLTDGSETFGTIRYDLVKSMLNLIVTPATDDNGVPVTINSLDEMYFGQILSFNTLVNEGIIIEITDTDE